MIGFEKALVAVKVIKDRIQYRSQSLLNLARGYLSHYEDETCTALLKYSVLTETLFCLVFHHSTVLHL